MALQFSEQNEYQNLIRLIHKYGGCRNKEVLNEIKAKLKGLYQWLDGKNG